jgi:hemerythrin-like metal-binding protein
VGRNMTDKRTKPPRKIVTPTLSGSEPFFVWTDCYALGALAIDEEHERFFDLANRLHSSIVADDEPASAKKILVDMGEYARRHFDDEEARLIASACPHLSRHRAEHRLFVMTLKRLQDHEEPSADDAFCLARDWILEHILGMDRQHSAWMVPSAIGPP